MKIVNAKTLTIVILIFLSQTLVARKSLRRRVIIWDFILESAHDTLMSLKNWSIESITKMIYPNNFVKKFKELTKNVDKDILKLQLKNLNSKLCRDKQQINLTKMWSLLKVNVKNLPEDDNMTINSLKELITKNSSTEDIDYDKLLEGLKDCDNLDALVSNAEKNEALDKVIEYSSIILERILSMFSVETRKFAIMIGVIIIFALVYMAIGVIASLIQLVTSFGITIFIFFSLRSKMMKVDKKP